MKKKPGELHEFRREEINQLLTEIRDNALLTEEEFVEKCLRDIMHGWVPMEQYLKMYPTETAAKVHKRVQNKAWQKQVHYAAPKGSAAWVNLIAIRSWLEGLLEADAAATRTD